MSPVLNFYPISLDRGDSADNFSHKKQNISLGIGHFIANLRKSSCAELAAYGWSRAAKTE